MAKMTLYNEDIQQAIKEYIVNKYYIDIGDNVINTNDLYTYGEINIELEDIKILK